MKSWQVHYMNKYPGGHTEVTGHSFKAYDADGKLRVALEKGGDGQWHDRSEEYGLEDRHDLSPIPKDSRVHKEVGGKLSKDDQAEEREQLREEFVENGKVQSCEELKSKGYAFDEKQRVTRRPEAKQEQSADAPAEKKNSKSKKK